MSSGTPTPILGLHTYEDTDSMLQTEVDENSAQIDTLPPTVCTSSTRPNTNLYQGRYIWESDRKRLLMWDAVSAAWKIIGDQTDDTGWVNCTARATFALMNSPEVAKVRRIGNRVFARGGYLNTNVSASSTALVGDLPAPVGGVSFAPVENQIFSPGMGSGANTAQCFIRQDSIIELRTGASLSAYFKINTSWLID